MQVRLHRVQLEPRCIRMIIRLYIYAYMVPRRKKPVLWASSVSCIKPRTRRGAHTRITALSTPGGKLGAATPAPLDHAPACHEVGVRWGGSFREGECRTSGVVRMGGQACGEGEGEGSIFWNGEAQRR